MRRILFTWDAGAFGGHDLTGLRAMEKLLANRGVHVGALHTGRNGYLTDELDKLVQRFGQLDVISVEALGAFSECIDGLFRLRRTRAIEKSIRGWQPDLVVNVQGFITLGLCVMGACRALGVKTVSYVPMTHRVWQIRPSFVSALQDVVNLYWYSLPNFIITTSERMKIKLVELHRVPAAKVAVVEYGPNVAASVVCDRDEVRASLGWSGTRYVGIVGRVEFLQKRQDFLIRTVAAYRQKLDGYKFVIIGNGPDLRSAVRLVEKLGVADLVSFVDWQKDVSRIYQALDVLLIPSRYEGMPLVMLEAMLWKVPVLASDVDGMSDLLPRECLFRGGDGWALVNGLISLPSRLTGDTIDRLSNHIVNSLNEKTFCDNFEREIIRLCKI